MRTLRLTKRLAKRVLQPLFDDPLDEAQAD